MTIFMLLCISMCSVSKFSWVSCLCGFSIHLGGQIKRGRAPSSLRYNKCVSDRSFCLSKSMQVIGLSCSWVLYVQNPQNFKSSCNSKRWPWGVYVSKIWNRKQGEHLREAYNGATQVGRGWNDYWGQISPWHTSLVQHSMRTNIPTCLEGV